MGFFTADALDASEYPGSRARQRCACGAAARNAGVEDARDARRAARHRRRDGRSAAVAATSRISSTLDCCAMRIWVRSGKARRASSRIDAVRRAIGRNGCQGAYQAALLDRLDRCAALPAHFVEELRAALRDAVAFSGGGRRAGRTVGAAGRHRAVSREFSACCSRAKVAKRRGAAAMRAGSSGRDSTLDHRLYPRGPLTRSDRGRERAVAAALLGEAALTHDAIAPLLAR